jgi:hypothetical protein
MVPQSRRLAWESSSSRGGNRGAGRGIAAALGEAGATVICTGRTTRSVQSEYNRPETIEETAELVTHLGGIGIAVAVDHLVPIAITPGWLRSEMMLDNYGVSEENWRDAMQTSPDKNRPVAPADFALSESPRYVGRAVVALAMDPDRARWNRQSVSSGQLASEYGFKDLDGSQPDIWRDIK